MRKTMAAAALMLIAAPLSAQVTQAQQDSVMAPIRRIFDAMRTSDSAALRAAFTPNAMLAGVGVRQGVPQLTVDTLESFIRFVGTPRTEAADERLRNEVVHIDGPLASVWVEYSFYIGTRFSHCGVDSFQLIRTAEGWKIFSLVDTRRRQGCPDQPAR